MAEFIANLQVKGDYGNPEGTGLSKITMAGMPWETDRTLTESSDAMATFHAAIAAAQLTDTVIGTKAVTSKIVNIVQKPGADVNVDRVLQCEWQHVSGSKVYQVTIPGVPESSTSIDAKDQGERLNEAGKAALATAIQEFYDFAVDSVVVLRGKVLQKK